MLTSNLKTSKTTAIFYLTLAVLMILPVFASARPNMPPKAMERIETLKKMKLLDVLNLSDQEADKFLAKYTSLDRNVKEKHQQVQKISNDLEDAIANKDTKNMEKLSDDLLKAQDELDQAITTRTNEVRQVLNKEQFAKYLVFERKFQEELRQAMMKKMQNKMRHQRDDD